MKEFTYSVTDPVGLHARPAGDLVREIQKFESACTVSGNGKKVDGKKLIQVMTLGIKQDQPVTVTFEGPDEAVAAERVEKFMKERL